MTASTNGWTESDSKLYQDIAAVAVPARAEQMAALLALLPFGQEARFRAVEVGCGEGILASALLDCFPQAQMVALDGSAEMRVQANRRLSVFGPRATVEPFDLSARDWYGHLQEADCVVSSLCLHHLDGPEKQDLFAVIFERLSAQGVFLTADLVKPQRPEARELFASTWDRLTEAQSITATGSTDLYHKFQETEWNLYRFPDPIDKPSPLFDQLTWLKTAGFEVVDCFWLQAGHAIYGGYKTAGSSARPGVSFVAALRTVETVLGADKPQEDFSQESRLLPGKYRQTPRLHPLGARINTFQIRVSVHVILRRSRRISLVVSQKGPNLEILHSATLRSE